MSWIVDNSLTWFQKFCINVLKCGPIPRHIAFIMDGNRRFANKSNLDRKDGHSRGFDKLSDTLEWCRLLGVLEVTVYAFSTENFKRSPDEVNSLMDLAREKFARIIEEKNKIMTNGVCVRVIGNLELLPEDMRKLVAEAMIMTKNNNKVFLNIAIAYTSREEITNSIQIIVDGISSGKLQIDDVNEQLLSNCLYTSHSPNPDVLIRTSGETRFSDFLLWQIQNTSIMFIDVLWPEFCIWHLLAIALRYQRHYKALSKSCTSEIAYEEENNKMSNFLKNLEIARMAVLEDYKNFVTVDSKS